MRLQVIAIMIIVIFGAGLFGCAAIPQEHKGAATGAGVGAATGVIGGAVLGGTRGAVIGGLLGALVGGAVGHYAYDQKRTGQETAQKYGYQSSTGTLVRIEDTSAVPNSVKPGDKVDLNATYAVIDKTPEAQTEITETREIKLGGEVVGRPEVKVSRPGGTYTSSVPLYLPTNAKPGTYTVTTTIQAAGAKDSRETSFAVK